MQSSNPVLTRYEKNDSGPVVDEGARLTIADVMVKSLVVFAITVVFAVVGWNTVDRYPWLLWVAMIAGLVLGFVNALKRVPSPPLIMLYALAQGLFLGAISNWYNAYAVQQQYQGIVLQAVLATMTTFGVMLTLYLTGIVKVTKKFASILIVAVVSYALLGMASLIAALFGVGGGWGFYGVSGIGLAICVFGVLLAAFFLMLDFEAINQGIKTGAPESESWRMAFGLLMTLIWLYLEFLRLLAIFSRN
jgi:uncharacterized YccA/Bax inhibitor family protein